MSKPATTSAQASANRLAGRQIQPDATLRSTPDTVSWGYLAANLSPTLTINSGQIVEIEALSQSLTTSDDPQKFFAAYGMGQTAQITGNRDATRLFAHRTKCRSQCCGENRSTRSDRIFADRKRTDDRRRLRLSSLAVDLGIGEAVDVVTLSYAKIPKSIFRQNSPYWFQS
jgi:hypothetical protein